MEEFRELMAEALYNEAEPDTQSYPWAKEGDDFRNYYRRQADAVIAVLPRIVGFSIGYSQNSGLEWDLGVSSRDLPYLREFFRKIPGPSDDDHQLEIFALIPISPEVSD